MSCASCASDTINQLDVTISPPQFFNGDVWNRDETAFVNVRVRNVTSSIMRNVVIRLAVSGAARVAPLNIFGHSHWDSKLFIQELRPGDDDDYWVRLYAHSDGNTHMQVNVCAEVIPYACNFHIVHRNDTITKN